jgi:hypothetical protein
MKEILRPEYYLLPGKHPAHCRCSEHAPKLALQAVSVPSIRETAAQIAVIAAIRAAMRF